MKKIVALLCATACCATAHAEWYQVKSVSSYNQITAFKPNEPSSEIKIRIKNLSNIEDIQTNSSKVLLSGQSAQDLAKDALVGQLVWIENLTQEGGIFVGTVYLSYEQVVKGYVKQHMVGGQTVSPKIRAQIVNIATKMLHQLDSTPAFENDKLILDAQRKAQLAKNHFDNSSATTVLDKESANWMKEQAEQTYFTYDSYYSDEYLKCIFVYEALSWFKDVGQFLPEAVQNIYVGWLASYQTAQPQKARDLEVKIRDMTVRYELYRDFIF